MTPEHKVLTNNGWIQFDELYNKYTTDIEFKQELKVAQLNNGVMEYVKPIDVFEFDYNDKIYKLESQLVDFEVTKDHMLYVKEKTDTDFKFISAEDAFNKDLIFINDIEELNIINESKQWIDYNGKVYCLQVPSNVFMVKYNEKNHWTGNCSRHG
jgi:hypothetical protein